MLNIYCPYCAEHRSEEEFHYAGEAHIARPENPAELSDEAWGDYLFFRSNPRGLHYEQWYHATGCRRFFNVARDTVTYAIHESYPMGAPPTVTRDSEEAA